MTNPLKDNLYIEQQEEGTSLFHRLQIKSLEELQRLSGKIWTDYNAHDPGVTIMEVLHYALTELDYRFNFPLQDYLTEQGQEFNPESFGFYSALKVFPVSPITQDDYRKYFIYNIQEIENIWIVPSLSGNRHSGNYKIYVEKIPGDNETSEEIIIQKIKNIYHDSRNLCENLEDISFIRKEELTVHGDLYITPEIDATYLVAQIFWEMFAFLSNHPQFLEAEEMNRQRISPEQWLEGPLEDGRRIEFFSRDDRRTETELYHKLINIKGVEALYSFHLEDRHQKIVNRFNYDHTVHIPLSPQEMYLNVWVNQTRVNLNIEKLNIYIQSFYDQHRGKKIYCSEESVSPHPFPAPTGVYHPIYKHDSIQDDFPHVYGINRQGLSRYETDLRKAQAKQLKAYLLLFDLTFARGLEELKELPALLKQQSTYPPGNPTPEMDPTCLWEILTDEKIVSQWEKRNTLQQKTQLLDLWDQLYGEDSNPAWLQSYNYYDEFPEDTILRRINFLRNIPLWGRNRFKGCNLYAPESISGIEKYIITLMDWHTGSVGNCLSDYDLCLISDKDYLQEELSKYAIIPIEQIRSAKLEDIPFQPNHESPGENYDKLWQTLPVFYYTTLFESLFHNGINLDNYKIFHWENDYLLVFLCKDSYTWVNLGYFFTKEKLIETANRVRHFLISLNRNSETLYLIEHTFFPTPQPFVLSVVLPGWSARMSLPHFREACENLLIAHLPAHIKVNFCWIDSISKMKEFEKYRAEWKTEYAKHHEENARLLMQQIQNIIQ